jgi:metallophosphoesterase (TIGR00282 family)
MRILYVGDVMAEMGVAVLARLLPDLKRDEHIDVVIAQSENVTDGKALGVADYERLKALGVDGFTGGNHSVARKEGFQLLQDPATPVTGPANMPDCPGPGYKYVHTPSGDVLIVSLLGKIVGRDAVKPIDNPLLTIDKILDQQKDVPRKATIVNFHGDFSSEKVVIGHYLDGRVTAIIGDHWHVPTADAMVLPKGTAHQTDVGMCGSLDSSLGVEFSSIIPRWRDEIQTHNILESEGRSQFNGMLIDSDDLSGLATHVEAIRRIY